LKTGVPVGRRVRAVLTEASEVEGAKMEERCRLET
jgi:hypothetical protein